MSPDGVYCTLTKCVHHGSEETLTNFLLVEGQSKGFIYTLTQFGSLYALSTESRANSQFGSLYALSTESRANSQFYSVF